VSLAHPTYGTPAVHVSGDESSEILMPETVRSRRPRRTSVTGSTLCRKPDDLVLLERYCCFLCRTPNRSWRFRRVRCAPPAPAGRLARLVLQALQRFGSFLEILSAKNCCSPAVHTNSSPQSNATEESVLELHRATRRSSRRLIPAPAGASYDCVFAPAPASRAVCRQLQVK